MKKRTNRNDSMMYPQEHAENIFLCLSSLEEVLNDMSADINTGVTLSSAQNAI